MVFFGPFILSNEKDSIVFQLISLRAALAIYMLLQILCWT